MLYAPNEQQQGNLKQLVDQLAATVTSFDVRAGIGGHFEVFYDNRNNRHRDRIQPFTGEYSEFAVTTISRPGEKNQGIILKKGRFGFWGWWGVKRYEQLVGFSTLCDRGEKWITEFTRLIEENKSIRVEIYHHTPKKMALRR